MPVHHNPVGGHREPFGLSCFHEANRKADDGILESLRMLLCPFYLDQMTAHSIDLETRSFRSWLILVTVGRQVLFVRTIVSTRHGKIGSCLVGCEMSWGEAIVTFVYI